MVLAGRELVCHGGQHEERPGPVAALRAAAELEPVPGLFCLGARADSAGRDVFFQGLPTFHPMIKENTYKKTLSGTPTFPLKLSKIMRIYLVGGFRVFPTLP